MTENTTTDTTVSTTGTEAASQSQTSTAPDTTKSAAATGTTPDTKATDAAATSTPGAEVIPPAYTPNYKFKAFNKEMELEEFWRPLIKDSDSEKKVKDLFTRAEAFNDLKERFEGTQSEFNKVYNEYSALDQDVRKVTSYLNKGDLDNFFGAIGLDEAKIFKWVAEKLDQENLPPEQKRALQMQQQERQRLYDLEMEKSTLAEQYQEQAVQARTMQLQLVLSRPEVSQAASAWDARMGTIGAFRDLIVDEAQKAWFVEGKDLSAEEAVQVVLAKYGKLIEAGGVVPQAPVPQATQAQAQSPQAAQKPVIPTVQGRGTSPVKKSPKSIDDLRQMAKELGV